MSRKYEFLLLLLIVGGVIWHQQPSTNAQPATSSMQTMINTLVDDNVLMTFTLREPLAPNLNTFDVRGAGVRAGVDHVCFSEPWGDNQTRWRCTPYSNVISLTYVETNQ
ncbi:MAG: hypothetical protein CUN56_10725 [Phototrophicales bacterium]|nr:MAG: hypothetical protein CUN56_10725 [Phototrophicales bacterium]RMG76562.1 MAG: hypothetical protein D6711_03585 [Chloroflexota bacterium]